MTGRRYPVGAEVQRQGGTHFRLWAPKRKRVQVILKNPGVSPHAISLQAEDGGYFSGLVEGSRPGSLYRFRLDDTPDLFPDPVSRFQPEGPHGPSQVVDPSTFKWTDRDWRGVAREGQVIYEMHIGTFTAEGTFAAALPILVELADLGITVLEIMPVAEFPGDFGWGYDGVNLFAPTRLYGKPDDFRSFVDRAHALGLGVILDVVYNHVGPDGNYLKQFADEYFTDRYKNEWGEALNFDGPRSSAVREFFLTNAVYWIEEFHLDGLRLDATQQIFDRSSQHILAEISQQTRTTTPDKPIYLVAENEPQHTRLVRPLEKDGFGMDALWNDDFHHAAFVALSGHREAYYTDYWGRPQEFISAAKWGYLYQGQFYSWQKKRRGTPALDLEPANFVTFLENHDQVANSGRGQRIRQLASPGRYRAMTALLCLGPGTPMFFQGQEYGSLAPFYFFADHHEELARLVKKGRAEFLSQFPSLARPEVNACLTDPSSRQTFESCKLNLQERRQNREILALHHDLLKLRKQDSAFRNPRRGKVDGAILGAEAFVLRFFAEENQDRLLVINLGPDLRLPELPEPLLAPPSGRRWTTKWSSESWDYGGTGHVALESSTGWQIPGESATVMESLADYQEPKMDLG